MTKTERKPSEFDKLASSLANSLTPEQYIKLLDIAHGPVPADIAKLSDDELLAELST